MHLGESLTLAHLQAVQSAGELAHRHVFRHSPSVRIPAHRGCSV
jgi:hypothetical protein